MRDFFELPFQFPLKSTVFELDIFSLHKNGIEFHQKTNEVCLRIEMRAKLAIWRQFLFTYAFLLIFTLASPLCSDIVLISSWAESLCQINRITMQNNITDYCWLFPIISPCVLILVMFSHNWTQLPPSHHYGGPLRHSSD